jgi:hypothetical protein
VYGLINYVWARIKGENIEKYNFNIERTQTHDPLIIVENPGVDMKISFPYKHE